MKKLIICLVSARIFAYSFTTDLQNGFYWAAFPIGMTKYVSDPSQGEELNRLANQAVEAWEGSLAQDLWEVGTGFQVSDTFSGNYIRWSFDFENETGYDGQSTLAVTTRYVQGTYIVRTDIILNGNHPVLMANNNGELYATILHEFGHTVGIGHSDEEAIMQASLSWHRNLTWDDELAINAVYEDQREKQLTSYVSPLAVDNDLQENALNFVGCGTISTNINSSGGGSFFLVTLVSLFLFIRIKLKDLFHLLKSRFPKTNFFFLFYFFKLFRSVNKQIHVNIEVHDFGKI